MNKDKKHTKYQFKTMKGTDHLDEYLGVDVRIILTHTAQLNDCELPYTVKINF